MGPSAFVLFDRKPTTEVSTELQKILTEQRFGINFRYSYPSDEYWEYDEAELLSIKEKTLMTVCGVLALSSPCNSNDDHKALGEAALIASKYLSGLIDFGGAICPPLPKEMYEGLWLWEQASWSDIEPFFLTMISSMNGKIYTIEYETANSRVWAHHICNSEFLANWLKHPLFRMIK